MIYMCDTACTNLELDSICSLVSTKAGILSLSQVRPGKRKLLQDRPIDLPGICKAVSRVVCNRVQYPWGKCKLSSENLEVF